MPEQSTVFSKPEELQALIKKRKSSHRTISATSIPTTTLMVSPNLRPVELSQQIPMESFLHVTTPGQSVIMAQAAVSSD